VRTRAYTERISNDKSLMGHPESSRRITNLNLRGTIKELEQLDGGFVVSHDGIVLSACSYLDAVVASDGDRDSAVHRDCNVGSLSWPDR
jgi:hypothetical protein